MDIDRSCERVERTFRCIAALKKFPGQIGWRDTVLDVRGINFWTKVYVVWIGTSRFHKASVSHPGLRLCDGEQELRERELNMSVLLVGCGVPWTRPMVILSDLCGATTSASPMASMLESVYMLWAWYTVYCVV